MLRYTFGLAALALITGCSQARPPLVGQCVLPAYELVASEDLLDQNGQSTGGSAGLEGTVAAADDPMDPFRKLLEEKIGPAPTESAPGTTPVARTGDDRPRLAVLSGGSQNGSFGAGLFRQLDEQGEIPQYQVMTSISTGALQSTFLFLARKDLSSSGRTYSEYMRSAPEIGTPGQTDLTDLRLAYALAGEESVMDVSSGGLLAAARKGSVASFDPLRTTLRGLISDDTIEGFADAHKEGRMLLVGVANLDDGKPYAIDFTELAQEQSEKGEEGEYNPDCFVEALLASSTVPPGVPPVTLKLKVKSPDGTWLERPEEMFVDGGARYGVFLDNVLNVAGLVGDVDVDIVVNSELFGKPWTDDEGNRIEKWSVVNVGLRTVDILQNQVYQLSVERALNWAKGNGTVRMAFISNNKLTAFKDDPMTGFEFNGKTCAATLQEDKEMFEPFEFHRNYMRCIAAYGEQRAKLDPWNLME